MIKKQSQSLFNTFNQQPVVPPKENFPSSPQTTTPSASGSLFSPNLTGNSTPQNINQTSSPTPTTNPVNHQQKQTYTIKPASKSVHNLQRALLELGNLLYRSSVFASIFNKDPKLAQSPLLEDIETEVDPQLLNKIKSSVSSKNVKEKSITTDGQWGNGMQAALKSIYTLANALVNFFNKNNDKSNYFGSAELSFLAECANTPPSKVNDELADKCAINIASLEQMCLEFEKKYPTGSRSKEKSLDDGKDPLTKNFDDDPNNTTLSEQIPGISIDINNQMHPITYNNIKNINNFIAFIKQYYPQDQEPREDVIYKAMQDVAKLIDSNINGGGVVKVSPI